VRMRSRKPCTLWRRRLFGWYVRLLTGSLRWCSLGRHAGRSARSSVGSDGTGRDCVVAGVAGVSAGTAHPRSPLELPARRSWTCGTRRHRVTEERYARRSGQVKSRSGAAAALWKAGPAPPHRAGRTQPPDDRQLPVDTSCRPAPTRVMFGARRVSPRSVRSPRRRQPPDPHGSPETAPGLR
jgi:hypothetical protein